MNNHASGCRLLYCYIFLYRVLLSTSMMNNKFSSSYLRKEGKDLICKKKAVFRRRRDEKSGAWIKSRKWIY